MKTFVLYILLCCTFSLWGQEQSTIQGRLIEEFSKDPIPYAKLYLQEDGALVAFAETDKEGNYLLANIQAGSYTLIISKSGFSPVKITDVLVATSESVEFNPCYENEGYDQDTIVFSFTELLEISPPTGLVGNPDKRLVKKQEHAAIKLN